MDYSNFITLGNDIPDPELIFLNDLKGRFDADTSDPQNLLKTLQFLNSPEYSEKMKEVMSHYRIVMGQLKETFDSCLSPYGKIILPENGLSLFIDLGQPVYFDEILFRLINLKVFDPEKNPAFNVCKPVTGIRVEFGTPDFKTWRTVFSDLADFFASDFVMWGKDVFYVGTSDPFLSLFHFGTGEFRDPTFAEVEELAKIKDYSRYGNDELLMICFCILQSAFTYDRTDWHQKSGYILNLIDREKLSADAQQSISVWEALLANV